MIQGVKEKLADAVRDFHLPRYEDIPDMGLYLEQVTKYINDCLAPLENVSLTYSMISNYVKRGLVNNPIKKQYYREHIAYLIFIAVTKNVLSLDNLQSFIAIQERTYDAKTAYNYFCEELENLLFYVFRIKESPEAVGTEVTDEKIMLRNTIITVAHQTYLDMFFKLVRAAEQAQ